MITRCLDVDQGSFTCLRLITGGGGGGGGGLAVDYAIKILIFTL